METNKITFGNILNEATTTMNESEFIELIKQQKKCLIVERGYNCYVGYIGTDKCYIHQLEIPFNKIHPFDEDICDRIAKEDFATQLYFIKCAYANKMSWLFAENNNNKFSAVFSKIFYEIKNEILESEKYTEEQKNLFYEFID